MEYLDKSWMSVVYLRKGLLADASLNALAGMPQPLAPAIVSELLIPPLAFIILTT